MPGHTKLIISESGTPKTASPWQSNRNESLGNWARPRWPGWQWPDRLAWLGVIPLRQLLTAGLCYTAISCPLGFLNGDRRGQTLGPFRWQRRKKTLTTFGPSVFSSGGKTRSCERIYRACTHPYARLHAALPRTRTHSYHARVHAALLRARTCSPTTCAYTLPYHTRVHAAIPRARTCSPTTRAYTLPYYALVKGSLRTRTTITFRPVLRQPLTQ